MLLTTELLAAGIIEEQDAVQLEEKLKGNDQVFEMLYHFFESKVFNRPQTGGFMSVSGFDEYIEPDSAESKPYRALLDILVRQNIIPAALHQKLNKFPLKGDKHGYFVALYLSNEWLTFHNNFTIEKQMEFAQQLAGNDPYGRSGMLNESKKNKLTKDINAGKLETYLDFFKYCHGCTFVDLRKYEGKQKQFLKALTSIVNGLCYGAYTILSVDLNVEDFLATPGYKNKQGTITIDTGAHQHQHTYTFWDNGKNGRNRFSLILHELLAFVNKLLTDYSITYRLTAVTHTLNSWLFTGANEVYAICQVSSATENIFEFYSSQRRFLFVEPFPITFWPVLSYTHIQYAVHHFRASGILSHLTDVEMDEVKSCIYQNTYQNIGDLLAIFPHTVAVTSRFSLIGTKPYAKFLEELNLISKGVLNFTDIADETPENRPDNSTGEMPFKVRFKCKSAQYEFASDAQYEDFDDRFLYYIINEIVRKSYPDHELMQVVGGSYKNSMFLFTTKEQGSYLHKMKLKLTVDRF